MAQPFLIFWDEETTKELRQAIGGNLVASPLPEKADAIVFGSDNPAVLRANPHYRKYSRKCIAITETDLPSYFIPALYASNRQAFLSHRRSRTISYFITQCIVPNLGIAQFAGREYPKRYLYSFMGGSTSRVRKHLFKIVKSGEDIFIEPTHSYQHWSCRGGVCEQQQRYRDQLRYAEIMAASKFYLCPRGSGISSVRLFETMQMGVAPVILADGWIPPSHCDWSFALFLRENQLAQLDSIIRSHQSEWHERGKAARAAYESHYSTAAAGKMVANDIKWLLTQHQPVREWWIHAFFPGIEYSRNGLASVRKAARRLVLKFLLFSGIKFPYEINPIVFQEIDRK
jgi:hypothetical protein